MPTPKQKIGLVAQYRDMSYARLNRLSAMMEETARQLTDPHMAEYAPEDFKIAAGVLLKDAKAYSNLADALHAPQEKKAVAKYDHGAEIHHRNELRRTLKGIERDY